MSGSGFGGGFGATTPGTSPGDRGGRPRREAGLNMVPILIEHLLKCVQADGSVIVCGQDVSTVTIVGLVQKADIQSVNYKYVIDDLSGNTIDVIQWLDTPNADDEDDAPLPPLMVNSYARVCGAVRHTEGKTFLVAFKATPLKHLNLLTMHLLETVHCKKILVSGKTVSGSSAFQKDATGTAGSGAEGSCCGLSVEQQMIYKFIGSFEDEIGCSLSDLLSNVKLPPAEIRKVLGFLSNEGHLYTTVDEEHFKLTST